jgi:hypothetical protein
MVSNVVILGSSRHVLDVVHAESDADARASAVGVLCRRFEGFLGRSELCGSFTLSPDYFSVKNICASVRFAAPLSRDVRGYSPDVLRGIMAEGGLNASRPCRGTSRNSAAEFRAICISSVPVSDTSTTPKGSKHKGLGNCMLAFNTRGQFFTGRIQGCSSLAHLRALFDKIVCAVGLTPSEEMFSRCVTVTNAVLCCKAFPTDERAAKLPCLMINRCLDVSLPEDGSSSVFGTIKGVFNIGNVLECVTHGPGV